jgi:methylenetetrahydrofolate reductase (NADPH)
VTTDGNLERILLAGRFAVTGECGPPRSPDGAVVTRKGALLKGAVDAVNVTDNPTGVVRMSSLASAVLLKDAGVEPVMQMVCRDRNRIALQSDLLGAAALGVGNVLCLSGDHQSFGDHPGAKNVFDIDSVQLIRCAGRMVEEGRLMSGREMKVMPRFFIGCVENPFTGSVRMRAFRLAKKVRAGARFVQTQSVFNVERFERWMEEVRRLGLHERIFVLAGVTPLKSLAMARRMRDTVPGMDVPDVLISRLEGVPPEVVAEEGIRIAIETIERLKAVEGVRGVHISAIEWEDRIPEIAERAGLLPRP